MSRQGQIFLNAAQQSQPQEEGISRQDQAFVNAANSIQVADVETNPQVRQEQQTSSFNGPIELPGFGLQGLHDPRSRNMINTNGRPSFQEQVPRFTGNTRSNINNNSMISNNRSNSSDNNSNNGIGVGIGIMGSGLDSITRSGVNTMGLDNSNNYSTTIGMRQENIDNRNISSSSSSSYNNNNNRDGQQHNNNNNNKINSMNSNTSNNIGMREQNNNRYSTNNSSSSSSSNTSGFISSTSQSTIPNSSNSYNKLISYRGLNNTNMIGNNNQYYPTLVRENEIPYTQGKLIILNPQGYNNPSYALFIDDYRLDRSLVHDLMNSTSRLIGHSTKQPGTKTPVVWVTDKNATWLLSVEEHEKVLTYLVMARISEVGLVGETSDPNHYSEVIYRLVSHENTQDYYFHRIMSLSMANILSCAPDNREYVNKWKQMGHALQITLKTKLTIGLQSR